MLAAESGQAAVLIALLSAVLLFFVAATTNIGKVVTEKIAMQNTADIAAYAGAATEAGYFNKIRSYNQKTWQVIYTARQDWNVSATSPAGPTGSFIWDPYDCPDSPMTDGLPVTTQDQLWQDDWVPQVQANNMAIQTLNNNALASAYSAAQQTADANYQGTSSDLHALQGQSGMMINTLQTKPVNVSYFGWCYQLPEGPLIPWPFRTTHQLDSWSYKQDPGEVVFFAQIKGAVPDSPFMDIPGNYFSGSCQYGETQSNGRCALDVYSVAQPFYGKLGSNLKTQKASWENLDTFINQPDTTQLDSTQNLLPSQVVGGDQNYYDYGTRFIGIFENVTVSGGKGTLSSMVPQYGSMMRH